MSQTAYSSHWIFIAKRMTLSGFFPANGNTAEAVAERTPIVEIGDVSGGFIEFLSNCRPRRET